MKPQLVAPDYGKHNADLEASITRVKGTGRYNPDTHKAWYEKNADKKRAYAVAYYAANKEAKLERAKKYGAENKELIKEKNRKRLYGVDNATVESMLKAQGGACLLCSKTFSFEGKGSKPHIDHDHNTGRVRGLLCLKCNLALAVVEKKDFLEKALKYLEVA